MSKFGSLVVKSSSGNLLGEIGTSALEASTSPIGNLIFPPIVGPARDEASKADRCCSDTILVLTT